MQKSNKATIITIILILLVGVLKNFKVIKQINNIYIYIINPLFWIIISILMFLTFSKNIGNQKLKKQIIQYTINDSISFIIIYMLTGLIVTFGKNSYDTTIKGIIINIWIYGIELIAREFIRYKLIDNVYDKDKEKIAILIIIIYVVIDIQLNKVIGDDVTTFSCIRYILQYVLPNIAKNILFSYMTIYSGCVPSIIYQLITNLYFWISPILPNSPWIMTTIIEITIPTILYLYIRYSKNKLDIFKSRKNLIDSNPKNIISLVIFIILVIWFAIGIFPIQPVSIATGSMEKELNVGDVVIIKKCNSNDVNVGDIIQYQMEGYTVIHRIIEKKQKNGEFSFITKGDNNNTPDKEEVKENQLIGKVVFKIKYIGYPAILLHNLQINNKNQNIQVET